MIKLCAFADEAGTSLESQISALKKHGIEYLELRSINGKNVADFTDEEVLNYKSELDKAGIKVWAIGSPIGKEDISFDFNDYMKKVKRIYGIANMFNAKRVRGFSFFNAYSNKEEVIKRLQTMVNVAAEYGITFCHENEKEIYGDVADRVLEIATEVKGIKLVYDPANYVQCKENAAIALNETLPYTEYFHIKDVDAKTDELVPSGYGDGDIKGLINKLKNKDAVLTLEPHLKVFDGYGSIDNTEMKNRFKFDTNAEAFDCAVLTLKKILSESGYKEEKGEFVYGNRA